jgi:hypothetical protein
MRLITGTGAVQCFFLTFYRLDTLNFGNKEREQVLVSKFVLCGITSVTSLAPSLTRIRKEMDSLLYKVSVIDKLLGTKNYILRSNEIYMRMQVTSLAFVLFIVYANDFVSINSGINIAIPATFLYVCNFIRMITIMQFVILVSLMRQKSKILNSYFGSAENTIQRRNDNNLWEIQLQTPRFRNEDNWKDDVLQMEAFC